MSGRLTPQHLYLIPFHFAASLRRIVGNIARSDRPTYFYTNTISRRRRRRSGVVMPSRVSPLPSSLPLPPSMRCHRARRNDPPSDSDRTTWTTPLLVQDSSTDSKESCITFSPALRDFDFPPAPGRRSPSLIHAKCFSSARRFAMVCRADLGRGGGELEGRLKVKGGKLGRREGVRKAKSFFLVSLTRDFARRQPCLPHHCARAPLPALRYRCPLPPSLPHLLASSLSSGMLFHGL